MGGTRVLGDDEPIVELIRTTALRAEVLAAQLRSAGVAVLVKGVTPSSDRGGLRFIEGARLYVGEADLATAVDIVEVADIPVDDGELAAQAEAAAGDSFGDGAVV